MMQKSLSVLVLFLSTSMGACSSYAVDIPFEALQRSWSDAAREYNVPSFSVAVVKNGKIAFADAYGHRDSARTIPATPDTMYYIASSTKSFTALAILKLADSGLINLDAPVKTYLPRFKLAEEPSEPITVRDLLSHRRGLDGETPLSLHEAYTGHEIDDDFYYSRIGGYVTATDQFRYGNLHYTLLGRIIEAVAGKNWKTYVEQEILHPVEINRTTTRASKAKTMPNVADMMYFESPTVWRHPDIEKVNGSMSAAGGMFASANDLAKWLQLHLEDGHFDGKQIVSKEIIRASRSPQVEINKRFGEFQREAYGMGWYVGSYADESLIHCFGAFASGARAHLSYMPEHGVGVAVVTNVARGPGHQLTDAIAADVYDAVLGREKPTGRLESLRRRLTETLSDPLSKIPAPTRENNPAVAPDALSLAASDYLGTFSNPEFGTIRFFQEDGMLYMSYGGIQRAELTTFRKPEAFIVFLVPRWLASVGQFVVADGIVTSVALDLPGTPEGVAMFTCQE